MNPGYKKGFMKSFINNQNEKNTFDCFLIFNYNKNKEKIR